MSLETIRKHNPDLNLYDVFNDNFKKYGRVIEGYDFSELFDYMEQNTIIPDEGNIYTASVEKMESMEPAKKIEKEFYGEMPLQIGYCNGVNSKLNGLEYHKGSEIDAAVTDLILLLGKIDDIKNNSYSSDKLEAFYIPRGTAVELYGTTLHFSPCRVHEEGFKCIVILPKGTNLPLENSQDTEHKGEARLLTAKNKWLLAHPERKILIDKGVYPGITGINIEVKL